MMVNMKASREAHRTRSLAISSMHRVALAPPSSPRLVVGQHHHHHRGSNGNKKRTSAAWTSEDAISNSAPEDPTVDEPCPVTTADVNDQLPTRGPVEVDLLDLVRPSAKDDFVPVAKPKQVIALDDAPFGAGEESTLEAVEEEWEMVDAVTLVSTANAPKTYANAVMLAAC